MAVTRKEAADKNNSPAKKSSRDSRKQAISGNLPVKKDKRKDVQVKKGPGKLVAARSYITGVWNELKKVHWPNRRETTIYTAVVFVAVLVVSAMIWIFDWLLSGLLQLIY